MPVGFASGCLVRYTGELFVLTVAHATENGGDWVIQIRHRPETGNHVYRLGSMNFISRGRLKKGKLHEVDFSYKRLTEDLSPWHQEIDESGQIRFEAPKIILISDLRAIPDGNQTYGFFGLTRQKQEGVQLRQVPKLETEMRYVRSQGDYHEFKLQKPYRKIEDYQGCSGAPILDETGALVALVVEGNKRRTGILGLNLNAYRPVLDAQILAERDAPRPQLPTEH